MDRRQFFRRGLDKIANAVADAADARARRKAQRWIRPPYAHDELDFLLTCTRCDECMQACPHDVIFPLPLSCGAEVAGTPALDVLTRGCHLCQDWPCVKACTSGALTQPSGSAARQGAGDEAGSEKALPLLAVAAIDSDLCLPYRGPECGACRDSCPIPGALTFSVQGSSPTACSPAERSPTDRSPTERSPTDRSPTERSPTEIPVIDATQCVGCGLCREVCVTEPKAVQIRALSA